MTDEPLIPGRKIAEKPLFAHQMRALRGNGCCSVFQLHPLHMGREFDP